MVFLKDFLLKIFLVGFLVDLLVDFLTCLCILFIALKILKFSPSGLVLINSKFCSQYSYLYVHIHQPLWQVCNHEIKDKFYNLSAEFAYFLIQMHLLLLLIVVLLWYKMNQFY